MGDNILFFLLFWRWMWSRQSTRTWTVDIWQAPCGIWESDYKHAHFITLLSVYLILDPNPWSTSPLSKLRNSRCNRKLVGHPTTHD